MDIQARRYKGRKTVIRTDCAEPRVSLCFPSLEACPYKFPSYSPSGWAAYDSTLVFITTEWWESLRIDGIEPKKVSVIAWKNRLSNKGGWVGMEAYPVSTYPFIIPSFSNAIIHVAEMVDSVILETDKGRFDLGALDGWANPYSWPANWVPIAVGSGIGAGGLGLASYAATRDLKIAVPLALVGAFAGAGLSWLFLH
jgi:hypothetical protein